MRAGLLNRVITFRRKSIAYNTLNEPIVTWADAFSVWAGMTTDGGHEFYAAQKKNAATTAVFKMRYRADVNAEMMIRYANRDFEILPPINDVKDKHTELRISVKEVI